MAASPNITIVLLAAGFSRRFGACKPLAVLPDERVMGLASLEPFRQLGAELKMQIIVVVRDYKPLVDLYLAIPEVNVVINDRAEQGIGVSLACAVGASYDSDAWLIALADMPYIQPATIEQLLSAYKKSSDIIAPLYQDKRGHPVIIGRDYREDLLALQQDKGAAFLFKQYPGQVTLLDCNDAGVLRDIDQPQDLLAD